MTSGKNPKPSGAAADAGGGVAPAEKKPRANRAKKTVQPDPAATTDVLFRLQAHPDVREIALVGEFNGWSQEAHRMERTGDIFEITVPLERGRSYRYRYLVDGQHWENDWNADGYVPNEFGSDDSVRVV
ncbi:MAG: isoamylase early set domain-containing protein [Actinobacteria bacterium]|nr:isoamylase early set domain-containing protein [Actinomycetota bacterium]